jgi:hypothetical protein
MAGAALIISTTDGARAAPVEYVRSVACTGGFWYIPGTDICINHHWFVGGFNSTSVGNAWFSSTDTLAAPP